MKLSVIIVNYNVRQFLENALTSIFRALEGLEGEVIVVDNASDDGSVEMVQKKFPAARVVASRENLGFARANNIGLTGAKGDYFLLINPDTIVQEDTLQVMLEFFRTHPQTGLAGCKILNPDGSFQLPCRRSFPTPWVAFTKVFGLSALFPRSRLFGRYNLTYLDPDASYEVDAVSGSFMMISRTAYERVGGLDESFFMYGEDLDWCYRVRQAGFKVYYVHSTQIVHFKGESTRRSNIDEVRVFYGAMELFVEKHFSALRIGRFFLHLGIGLRGAAAMVARFTRPLVFAFADGMLVVATLIMAERLYFGHVFHFPHYAYPIVWVIPATTVLLVSAFLGVYALHRGSVRRAATAVVISYVLIAAAVFFFKEFAFSRAVVLISGALAFVLLPAWRAVLLVAGGRGGSTAQHHGIFGSRTLIVGTGAAAQEVLRRLRARVTDGYDVRGFIDTNSARIGERIGGVEIVGSLENVGKVIDEQRITDVIFSTDELPYTAILTVIARSNNRSVNFRLVPTSLESIIGKTRIDDLDTLPLVDIDYNIHRLRNRVTKRILDLIVSTVVLLTAYPLAWVMRTLHLLQPGGRVAAVLDKFPRVFWGDVSLVGRSADALDIPEHGRKTPYLLNGTYLGPEGITGLVQLHSSKDLSREEREHYELYYAKNQSLLLDAEILLKWMMNGFKG
jgi:O-antigen biosynthesis protein